VAAAVTYLAALALIRFAFDAGRLYQWVREAKRAIAEQQTKTQEQP
jgi:hypothetical protein